MTLLAWAIAALVFVAQPIQCLRGVWLRLRGE